MPCVTATPCTTLRKGSGITLARTLRDRQGGLGLIEVLVAVVVLSIGILGVAALQVRALAGDSSSAGQSLATVASYSILDALRADKPDALAGKYNTTNPLVATNCPAGGNLVAAQLKSWCTNLGTMLGLAQTTTGNIDCSKTGYCTITVTFDNSHIGGNGEGGGKTAQSLVTVAQL